LIMATKLTYSRRIAFVTKYSFKERHGDHDTPDQWSAVGRLID
jgi:hypothetical protein